MTPLRMTLVVPVYQDGGDFYRADTDERLPFSVDFLVHDNETAADARAVFIAWCADRTNIEPEFVA